MVASKNRALPAHVVPFGVFMAFLALVELLGALGGESGVFWLADPKYWVFPLQTVACAAVLLYYWKDFHWGPIVWGSAILAGMVSCALWVAPQAVLGFPARTDGFDPAQFASDPAIYWFTLVARLARLIVVVPLVEEIFWRGFFMRYLIREDFVKVPFGSFSILSFFGVAGAFMLVHSMSDWPAALATGLLFGWVAVRTKSLFAVVLAHAVANIGLGAYIMSTKQWGFW